jgi:hypothetical protein
MWGLFLQTVTLHNTIKRYIEANIFYMIWCISALIVLCMFIIIFMLPKNTTWKHAVDRIFNSLFSKIHWWISYISNVYDTHHRESENSLISLLYTSYSLTPSYIFVRSNHQQIYILNQHNHRQEIYQEKQKQSEEFFYFFALTIFSWKKLLVWKFISYRFVG